MTNRRKPSQRPTSTSWSPGRPRAELVKAIGGATGVVVLTALIIVVIKPGDIASSTPSPTPGVTVPNSSTGSTGSTGSTATTAPTTATTAPASSTTQP